jgi:hypothetical protein
MQYERTCSIERAEDGADAGLISGILATDGEASDGHILNMDGVKLPDRAPLLFGHDDYTGTGNLGSWTGFDKYGDGKKLGKSGIRGNAQIELDGEGSQAAWRADINHMIERGHIGRFSVRWEEIGDAVARVNLPSDHPAYVDSKKATGRQRWGLYFDKWRLMEGSVVTLGADPAALVGRMQESKGDVRAYWRATINHALTEREEVAGLVGISIGDGREVIYVERAAYDAMLEEANRAMAMAINLHEETVNDLLCERVGADEPTAPDREAINALVQSVVSEELDKEEIRSEVEPDDGDEPTEEATPERETQAARLPAQPEHIATPKEIVRAIREGLEEAAKDVATEFRAEIRKARGRVE